MPAQHKRHSLSFGNREFRDGGKVFALQVRIRMQHQSIGTGDRAYAGFCAAHPGYNRAIVEMNDELHAHGNLAAPADDYAHDVRFAGARRHAVDHRDRAVFRFKIRFKNERALAIPATCLANLFGWREQPAAVIFVAQ